MSEKVSGKSEGPVLLRRPQRLQAAMVVQCPDDPVSAGQPLRMVLSMVQRLYQRQLHEPIKARRVALWSALAYNRMHFGHALPA